MVSLYLSAPSVVITPIICPEMVPMDISKDALRFCMVLDGVISLASFC